MSEGAIPMKTMVFVIVITWILSLVTTLAIVYVAPNILPIKTGHISDEAITGDKIASNAIITTKLADGTVTSAKILDGTLTAVDMADGSITTIIIDDGAVTTSKLADEAVTDVKLAPQAIPFNSTYQISPLTKSTFAWENVTGTSVTITVKRNSTLLIMFSAESSVSTANNDIQYQAIVNTDPALPGAVWLQPHINVTSGVSYNFYKPNVGAGVYEVYIQWAVWVYPHGGFGRISDRTLIVIALPT